METYDVFYTRKSIRKYKNKKISEKQLNKILEVVHLSPVGKGKYDDLHITVITNREALKKISESTKGEDGTDLLHGAPVFVIASVRYPEKANKSEEEYYLEKVAKTLDAAIIIENIILATTDQGLGNCHIEGAILKMQKNKALLSYLNIPSNFTPVLGCVFGESEEPLTKRKTSKYNISMSFI